MRKSLMLLFLAAIAIKFNLQTHSAESALPPVQAAKLPYTQTSVLQLIAHPERFYNRNIRVSGYYLSWYGLAISLDHYLSEELVVNVITDDAELTYDVCDTNLVILEGHFLPVFAQDRRHTYGRIIPDRLTIKSSDEVCWQRTEPFDF